MSDPIPVHGAGVQDDTDIQRPLEDLKAPDYVVRLLCGAKAIEMHNFVQMAFCDYVFQIPLNYFERIQRIAQQVRDKHLIPRGIDPARASVENVLAMQETARIMWDESIRPKPEKLRVFFLATDTGGCGFYRCVQPARMLSAYTDTIIADAHLWAGSGFFMDYDVIVASRVIRDELLQVLLPVQAQGPLLVFEVDDNLSCIPDHSPARGLWNEETVRGWDLVRRSCDAAIVSTEELKTALEIPDKTYVCQNAIAPALWPMKLPERPTSGKVRVVWWGSDTHEEDLREIVPAVKHLCARRKDIQFVFCGWIPTAFGEARYERGKQGGRLCPRPEWEPYMEAYPGVYIQRFPSAVQSLRGDIAMAPLVDNPFNRCKSAIKVYEAWASGIPIVTSPVGPYLKTKAVLHAKTTHEWCDTIVALADSKQKRKEMAEAGLRELRASSIDSAVATQYERTLLTIARGKVSRPECNAMIEKRLAEMGRPNG